MSKKNIPLILSGLYKHRFSNQLEKAYGDKLYRVISYTTRAQRADEK